MDLVNLLITTRRKHKQILIYFTKNARYIENFYECEPFFQVITHFISGFITENTMLLRLYKFSVEVFDSYSTSVIPLSTVKYISTRFLLQNQISFTELQRLNRSLNMLPTCLCLVIGDFLGVTEEAGNHLLCSLLENLYELLEKSRKTKTVI